MFAKLTNRVKEDILEDVSLAVQMASESFGGRKMKTSFPLDFYSPLENFHVCVYSEDFIPVQRPQVPNNCLYVELLVESKTDKISAKRLPLGFYSPSGIALSNPEEAFGSPL